MYLFAGIGYPRRARAGPTFAAINEHRNTIVTSWAQRTTHVETPDAQVMTHLTCQHVCYSERAGAPTHTLYAQTIALPTAYDATLCLRYVLFVAPSYQPNLAVTLGGAPSLHIRYDACHSAVYSSRE